MNADSGNIVQRRPTEIIGGAAQALAFLIVYFLGIEDPGVYFALGIVLAFVPAAITWVVTLVRGGSS